MALLCTRLLLRNSTRNYHFYRIKDLSVQNCKPGHKVNVKGWVKSVRNMKGNLFVDINDGSAPQNFQLVINKEKNIDTAYGSSVEACGVVVASPKNQLELHVDSLTELGKCPLTEGYPFYPKKSYPPEYIRNHLHLRSRVNSMASTFRVRHEATRAFNEYLQQDGFVQIHTPVLTSNDCEGAGEAFLVKPLNDQLLKGMAKENIPLEHAYFDRPTFLTVSGQLHLEAMSHGLDKVYTFGPTFRAENCKSNIHLSEFYMLELEEAFMDTLEALMQRVEDMLKKVTTSVIKRSAADLRLVRKLTTEGKLEKDFHWMDKPFPRLTYEEAMNILEANEDKLKSPVRRKEGINKEQELFLVEHCQGPVFVCYWPKELKSFYMRESATNPLLVDALDLLVPHVGELVGGSVREDSYERLERKLPNQDVLQWYLDLRKFGSVTTAGFGLGFERYLGWLLNVHNIKDVIPFPRWAHNCVM
ncbi:probable asparagine--tRNA ligase, mitochondrial [Anopheles marshallii]|uniref:probable asparagine--tRNA ligase, mitochondrial n=1 Tax=Anopheles marshallii TaxID=1521116 RepID=UPI00237AB54D|nr:probable asparagine--tRNA ligase, mitochondrial [Anopheles marshallii]